MRAGDAGPWSRRVLAVVVVGTVLVMMVRPMRRQSAGLTEALAAVQALKWLLLGVGESE